MKVSDLVRYTSCGDALGLGTVLELGTSDHPRAHQGRLWPAGSLSHCALVFWCGETRGMNPRWINSEYLEVISESR